MPFQRAIAELLMVTLLTTIGPAPLAFSQTQPAPGVGGSYGTSLPPVLFQETPVVAPVGARTGTAAPPSEASQQASQPTASQSTSMGSSQQALEFAAASVTDIENYMLGPGDRLGVHIIVGDNALNLDYQFIVSPAGKIFFPAVGEVNVAGFRYKEFRNHLRNRIQRKFKERFELSVILEGIRMVRVHVFGNVLNPGPRIVSALARVSDVIEQAGVLSGGSTRLVILKRQGEMPHEVDLYDYFKRGDLSANLQLEAGDVLGIPKVGDLDTIQGAVYRPGTYEIKPGETVKDLLEFAGGLTKFAVWDQAILLNQLSQRRSAQVVVDTALSDRDLLYIPGRNIKVQIIGEVENPGLFDLYAGQTMRDLIKVAGGLKKSGALQDVVYLTRKLGKDTFEDRKLNIYKLMYEGDESQNVPLEDGDIVTIPSIELFVYVYGEVGAPGRLPYVPGRKLSDYLSQAGGPSAKANLAGVSISRFEEGRSRVLRVNAADILERGRKDKDIDLRGGDVVSVPGRFFYFSDFSSLASLIFTGATMYGLFFRR